MKKNMNDTLRAQTIRAGDRIADLFNRKKPLVLQKARLDQGRKHALQKGDTAASIRIGDRMIAVDRRIQVIDKKIAPLDTVCYHNYRILTGN